MFVKRGEDRLMRGLLDQADRDWIFEYAWRIEELMGCSSYRRREQSSAWLSGQHGACSCDSGTVPSGPHSLVIAAALATAAHFCVSAASDRLMPAKQPGVSDERG